MCEAIRAVSVTRFGQLIGTAGAQTLDAIRTQILLWLGAESWARSPRNPRCAVPAPFCAAVRDLQFPQDQRAGP